MSGSATADGIAYLLNLAGNGEPAVEIYYLALILDNSPGFTVTGVELDEPEVADYARAVMVNDSASWTVADETLSNAVEADFVTASTDWGTFNYWAICDQAMINGGRVLFVGQFDTPVVVAAGQQVVVPPGSMGIDMAGYEWQVSL